MSRFVWHVTTVILFWIALSLAASLLLTKLFGTPIFFGLLFLGLGGGAWSSYQAYRKYHGRE